MSDINQQIIERIAGNVVVAESGCWHWRGRIGSRGYGQLYFQGRAHAAHRLSLVAHGGVVGSAQIVLHSCDNRICVNPAHLRAGTHEENRADMIARGRQARGTSHAASVLTEADVAELRHRYATGTETQRELAAIFGVTSRAIWAAVTGHGWRHVEGPTSHRIRRGHQKLSDAQVAAIRARVAAGASQRETSVEFGISNQFVSSIVNNKKRVARESARSDAT